MARTATLDDPRLGPLTDDLLTPDVRVFQRKSGHRFSSDDVATAWVAHEAAAGARRALDMGCGLGSVLLLLAWRMEEASFVGIEAQEMSFELARRNVARNASVRRIGERVVVRHGDLRDPSIAREEGAPFDLVTGTPPYFPPGTAVQSADEQRTLARIEERGGVEAYLAAASLAVAESGTVVLCADSRAAERVDAGAATASLTIASRVDVVPRENRPPLFSVWVLGRDRPFGGSSVLTLRDAEGRTASDANRLRTFCGFLPLT